MFPTHKKRKSYKCEECGGKIIPFYSPFGLRVRHCEDCGIIYERWANLEYERKKLLDRDERDERDDRRKRYDKE